MHPLAFLTKLKMLYWTFILIFFWQFCSIRMQARHSARAWERNTASRWSEECGTSGDIFRLEDRLRVLLNRRTTRFQLSLFCRWGKTSASRKTQPWRCLQDMWVCRNQSVKLYSKRNTTKILSDRKRWNISEIRSSVEQIFRESIQAKKSAGGWWR